MAKPIGNMSVNLKPTDKTSKRIKEKFEPKSAGPVEPVKIAEAKKIQIKVRKK